MHLNIEIALAAPSGEQYTLQDHSQSPFIFFHQCSSPLSLSIEIDTAVLPLELNLLTALSVTVPTSAPPEAAELICQ